MNILRNQISVTFLLIAFIALGQEITDTITPKQLQEVVISAPKVIRKADMDVYYPSRSSVDNSKNGLQLLNNLMIPSLSVTESLGSIKAAGRIAIVQFDISHIVAPSLIENWHGICHYRTAYYCFYGGFFIF